MSGVGQKRPAEQAQHSGRLRKVIIGAKSIKGGREYQEDRHVEVAHFMAGEDDQPRSLAAVFDGHKTQEAAQIAAENIAILIKQEPGMQSNGGPTSEEGLQALDSSDQVAGALRGALLKVDDKIMGSESNAGDAGGSTALVIVTVGQALYSAHIGDSGAVLDRDGTAYRLTVDHKPNIPEERKRIEQAGGHIDSTANRVISQREGGRAALLSMSRALGDSDYKQSSTGVTSTADVRRVDLTAHDRAVIMGSDGVWDVLGDQEAVDILEHVLQGQPPSQELADEGARRLVKTAADKGSMDNITAVVELFVN